MDAEKVQDTELADALVHVSTHWDENRAELALDGFHQRRRRRTVTRAAGAVAAAVMVVMWAWPALQGILAPTPEAAPSIVAQSDDTDTTTASSPFTMEEGGVALFDDGTRAVPTSASADLVVASITDERVSMRLGAGSARFEVTPDRTREFEVVSGDVTVTVLGTVFDVSREGDEVRVDVTRGRVRVAGPHGEKILTKGMSVEVPATAQQAALEEPTKKADPKPKARKPRVKKSADWRTLAEKGDFGKAAKILRKKSTKVPNDVDALMLAADSMRMSGRPSDALGYLDRVVKHHRKDARAPLAMFTRGRVLSKLGRPREAAEAFSKVPKLGSKRSLTEDALAREVEAWHRAGVTARARERAQDYLDAYPRGVRAQAVRSYGGLD